MVGRIVLLACAYLLLSEPLQGQPIWQRNHADRSNAAVSHVPQIGMYAPTTSSLPKDADAVPGQNPFRVEMPEPLRPAGVPRYIVPNLPRVPQATATRTPKLQERTWSTPIITPEQARSQAPPRPLRPTTTLDVPYQAPTNPQFSPSFRRLAVPQPLRPSQPYHPEQARQVTIDDFRSSGQFYPLTR